MTLPDFKSFEQIILSDGEYVEEVCMHRHLMLDVFASSLKEFFKGKSITSEWKQLKNIDDIKRNFYYWLPSHLARTRNGYGQTENKRNGLDELRERNIRTLLDGEN